MPLRFYLPCAAARTLNPHASRRAAAGRLARFTPVRGRSITTPSQHVRPALRADRPRFAALLSSCAQGSALLIFSASLCQYKCCALFLPQLAAHLSPLRRCSALCFSSANTLPPPAAGSGRVFAPSGAREDLVRRAESRPSARRAFGHALLHPGFFVAHAPQNDRMPLSS